MKPIAALLLALATCGGAQSQGIDTVQAAQLVTHIKTQPGVQVVNFWSALCQPCVQEIPYYLTVVDSFWQLGYPVSLTMVSLDFASQVRAGKVQAFLDQRNWWAAKQFWLNEQYPDEYVPKIDSSWFGALPATKIAVQLTGYQSFYDGSLTRLQLVAALQKAVQGVPKR